MYRDVNEKFEMERKRNNNLMMVMGGMGDCCGGHSSVGERSKTVKVNRNRGLGIYWDY